MEQRRLWTEGLLILAVLALPSSLWAQQSGKHAEAHGDKPGETGETADAQHAETEDHPGAHVHEEIAVTGGLPDQDAIARVFDDPNCFSLQELYPVGSSRSSAATARTSPSSAVSAERWARGRAGTRACPPARTKSTSS